MLLKSSIRMLNLFAANVGASFGKQVISQIEIVHIAFLFILRSKVVENYFFFTPGSEVGDVVPLTFVLWGKNAAIITFSCVLHWN